MEASLSMHAVLFLAKVKFRAKWHRCSALPVYLQVHVCSWSGVALNVTVAVLLCSCRSHHQRCFCCWLGIRVQVWAYMCKCGHTCASVHIEEQTLYLPLYKVLAMGCHVAISRLECTGSCRSWACVQGKCSREVKSRACAAAACTVVHRSIKRTSCQCTLCTHHWRAPHPALLSTRSTPTIRDPNSDM